MRHALPWRRALAWALCYAMLAAVWVAGSDAWIASLDLSREARHGLQTGKGLFFVLFTSVVVFFAVWSTHQRFAAQRRLLLETNDKLRAQERRWSYLLANVGEFAWFTTLDGKVEHVSAACTRIYGRPPEDFAANPSLWRELVHPDDGPAVDAAQANLWRQGSRTVEYRIRHTDGTWRWLRDRSSLQVDAQGRPIAVGGVAEDITAHREAESRLRERELQLSGIVETAMDAIISVDAEQRIVLFNQAAGRMFRVRPEGARGRRIESLLPPRLRRACRARLAAIADRAGAEAVHSGTVRLLGRREDGEEFPLEASLSKVSVGERLLMTVVVRDITAQRDAELARRAQANAEAASRAKTAFLSRMSHELRTPLNAVLGFAQLLQSSPKEPLSEQQMLQVEYIRQAGWHLLALINDVLDVSRIESGFVQVQARSMELQPLLDEALLMSQNQADLHGVRLVAAYREAPPAAVCADATRLRQVMLNVLSNAIKYNRPGGKVRCEVAVSHDRVHVTIADTGIGMTRDQLAHLYEPFNRLGRDRGGVEGTGIGLVLTRQLVLLMNGTMRVESEPGTGTQVHLTLPSGESLCHEPTAPMPLSADAPGDDPPSGVVLYIEDNPVNMLVVQQLLARWPDVHLAHAEDGVSGLQMARSLQPDLVLLDMRLPDMTGTETLAALRDDRRTAALPVVALSASAMAEDIALARRHGALEYWTKPLDFERFTADMRRLLGGAVARTPRAAH